MISLSFSMKSGQGGGAALAELRARNRHRLHATSRRPSIEPGAPRGDLIAYRQANVAASSVLPVPLYRAVIGYAHSRMRSYHLRAAEFAHDDARWCLLLLHRAT